VIVAALALLAAQVFGVARNYLCDCGGAPVQVSTDHCVGPHGAECHSAARDDSSPGGPVEKEERRDHQVQTESLLGIAKAAQVITIPIAPVVQVLPAIMIPRAFEPRVIEMLEVPCGGDSPPVEIARTVVLRI
jgi:hypothetical protein